MAMAPRTRGSFFLLQLEHVVETNYESATVVTKIENIQQTYQQYCKFGTVPKAHKTPGTSHTSTWHDDTQLVERILEV